MQHSDIITALYSIKKQLKSIEAKKSIQEAINIINNNFN